MQHIHFVVVICYFLYRISSNLTAGEEIPSNETTLNRDWAYCFEFTWFGPEYDNYTRYNGTCSDYRDQVRTQDIPCSPPIVISENGTLPDIDYLWQNHRASVLCRRSNNQVCARYVYKYDGKVNNATYMCTKVQSIGEGAITSGCYIQDYQGYHVELCVCESNTGLFKPCNTAIINVAPYYLLALLVFNVYQIL